MSNDTYQKSEQTNENKRLRHYQVVILLNAADFKTANEIAENMLEKSPFAARIMQILESVIYKDT